MVPVITCRLATRRCRDSRWLAPRNSAKSLSTDAKSSEQSGSSSSCGGSVYGSLITFRFE